MKDYEGRPCKTMKGHSWKTMKGGPVRKQSAYDVHVLHVTSNIFVNEVKSKMKFNQIFENMNKTKTEILCSKKLKLKFLLVKQNQNENYLWKLSVWRSDLMTWNIVTSALNSVLSHVPSLDLSSPLSYFLSCSACWKMHDNSIAKAWEVLLSWWSIYGNFFWCYNLPSPVFPSSSLHTPSLVVRGSGA